MAILKEMKVFDDYFRNLDNGKPGDIYRKYDH
jgi:hypothetical protein